MHLHKTGVLLKSWNMSECASVGECIDGGRKYIKHNGIRAGQAVFGYLWNQDSFTNAPRHLNRHDLDRVSAHHPVVAYRACGHLAACNSMALGMAGITRDTKEADGGEIRRNDDGEPNGIITENALALLDALKHEPGVDEMAATVKAAMDHAVRHGITSVQTNDVRDGNAERVLDAYGLLYNKGEAVLRTYHQCCFGDLKALERFINAGRRMGNEVGCEGRVGMHRIGPVKLFMDGSLGAHTAAMRAPYLDAPNTSGVYCMTRTQLDEMVAAAEGAGFGCVVHAIGDGAIDRVLSSFEERPRNGRDAAANPLRHGIIHCQITDLPLLERFRKSDILAYVQPIFLRYDHTITEARVGPRLAETSYAFNTMDELGIQVSYGTDAPIEGVNPMHNLHCAVNRKDLEGKPTSGFHPRECVGLSRAIDNYTTGSAYASFDEHRKGRIKAGHMADMCVLDADIFGAEYENIKDINVCMTVLAGDIVYGE
jgi:hypothetical protein